MYLLLPCKNRFAPLYPWKGLFALLSMAKFAEIYPLFNFPVEPTAEIRHIAGGFFEATYSPEVDIYGLSEIVDEVPEAPLKTVNFFSRIPDDLPHSERQTLLFQLVFTALEEIGCAAAIYEWAAESSYFPPLYRHREQINTASFILKQWALERWSVGHFAVPDHRSDLKTMLQQWEKPRQIPDNVPMPLDNEAQAQLFLIVLDNELKNLCIEDFCRRVKRSIATPWEASLFFRGTVGGVLIRQEGRFRTAVSEWRAVRTQLSASEVGRIETWLLAQKAFGLSGTDFTIPPSALEK